MKMVIVTLSCTSEGAEKSYDMEMPCQIAVKPLTAHILQTLSHYTENRIQIDPAGRQLWCRRLQRVLQETETLEDAGIWNGDHLDLR